MDKSGAAVMDGIGYTKSSPSFAPIEIIDPHPPKAPLERQVSDLAAGRARNSIVAAAVLDLVERNFPSTRSFTVAARPLNPGSCFGTTHFDLRRAQRGLNFAYRGWGRIS
jgi:hypothetical protein